MRGAVGEPLDSLPSAVSTVEGTGEGSDFVLFQFKDCHPFPRYREAAWTSPRCAFSNSAFVGCIITESERNSDIGMHEQLRTIYGTTLFFCFPSIQPSMGPSKLLRPAARDDLRWSRAPTASPLSSVGRSAEMCVIPQYLQHVAGISGMSHAAVFDRGRTVSFLKKWSRSKWQLCTV